MRGAGRCARRITTASIATPNPPRCFPPAPHPCQTSRIVLDAAVHKAYNGSKSIQWLEVLAGEKAFRQTGEWLPEATLDAFKKYLVGIKGPLTTPVGGGIRSLNVALRQQLDLYV